MNTKKIYTKEDFNPMSWSEFGEILSQLTLAVTEKNKSLTTPIDAIVPVLRSGAIPAYPIAIHLGTRAIAPISVIRGQCLMSGESSTILTNAKHALLCEVNVVTGKTARNLKALLQKEHPHLRLSFLAIACAYGTNENDFHFDNTFIGSRTNERHLASKEEMAKLNIREGITLFPWENLELELKEINL